VSAFTLAGFDLCHFEDRSANGEDQMTFQLSHGAERLTARAIGLLAALAMICSTAFAQAQISPETRLKERNMVLPPPPKPVGNYVEWVRVGNLLYLAGHGGGAQARGKGKVGKDLTPEQGNQEAREVGLYLLATTRDALGTLDKVKRVVKVLGMVNSAPGFGDQPKVINGFSDLMVEVFGDAGKHARSAVGMAELPFGIPVEIEMVVEVSD
jgi:enamine deaminase RidA (YjgF/YER057c/UK114 family)